MDNLILISRVKKPRQCRKMTKTSAEESSGLEKSKLAFQKRKRIMSDNHNGFRKRFSPKKSHEARKTSISDSDFKVFYNAFEQQQKKDSNVSVA